MKYVFNKEGYDLVASSENDLDAIYIRNVSKLRAIRNMIILFISDIGFKYKTKWSGVDYEITPNFGGYGYRVTDYRGNKVGKVKSEAFGNVRIVETSLGDEILLEEGSASDYVLKMNGSEIGIIKTNGIVNRFPIEIDLSIEQQPAAHLLALFAVMKCV